MTHETISEERIRQYARRHVRHEGNRSVITAPAEEIQSMADEILRLRAQVEAQQWRLITSWVNDGNVVLFCDERGNRWTDCNANMWLHNGCGFPTTHWRPLPPPPPEQP